MLATQATPTLPRARTPGPEFAAEVRSVLSRTQAPRLVLQPIVDLQAGRVVGYEALARFGARLSTGPGAWFSAAAELSQSAELEALLIEQGLAARADLPPGRYVSINANPTLLASPAVARALRTTDDLSGVVIELTEHVEFGRSSGLLSELLALRARGAQLALDDVGAGWAGLRQVVELRPDIVKLDRSLVADADRDEVKLALIEMMLRLCSRLGSKLLVEGVETYDELDAFARMGVPLGQGWVFGKPTVKPQRIDDDLAVRLKFRAGLTRHIEKLASLVDMSIPTTSDARDPWRDLRSGDMVVVLDEERRPAGIAIRTGSVTQLTPVMTAVASESTNHALLRAMTRPSDSRFAPLVCVDRAGRYVGIIRADALARAVARQSDSTTITLPP